MAHGLLAVTLDSAWNDVEQRRIDMTTDSAQRSTKISRTSGVTSDTRVPPEHLVAAMPNLVDFAHV